MADLRQSFESKSLRQLRLRAGLTPQQLAERIGVTRYTIQTWEKGQHAVRKPWLGKLAAALGCSVVDLRQSESFARSKRWRRAWVHLSADAQSARPWEGDE